MRFLVGPARRRRSRPSPLAGAGSVIAARRRYAGCPIYGIGWSELDMAVGMEIERGRIASRDDVLAWLEAQGHRIKRKGKNYISVECLRPRERGGPRNAPNCYAKAIRLCGDLFDERFTSPAWLDECGWNDGGLPPQRRDMRGAAATLDRLRALRAAHHRERLGWPEEAPDPEPDAEDEIEGTTCAWSPPLPTLGRQPDTRTKPRRPTLAISSRRVAASIERFFDADLLHGGLAGDDAGHPAAHSQHAVTPSAG
ncbi:hypothetical protein [Paracoccus mutanolyticus]|uniref:hypothetical protein n=1 Tax=Paracoccus mutanolyticus TaxID=1499308 RepID=UPI0021D52C15|nr:hypothetical protein [Paracoccus mutanolyticus]